MNELIALLTALVVTVSASGGGEALAQAAGMPATMPRGEKVRLLEEDHGYDSYLIGSEAAGAYDIQGLSGYLDASFYDLTGDGEDITDYCALGAWVLQQYEVEHIVLAVDLPEAAGFTGQTADLGEDAWVRDVEKVGDPAVYQRDHGAGFAVQAPTGTPVTAEEAGQALADLQSRCKAEGATLTVIASPVSAEVWKACGQETLSAYLTALAGAADLWDFSLTPLSYDGRYFYDAHHFRPAAGDMVLAEVFGDQGVWRPEGLGAKVTKASVGSHIRDTFGQSQWVDPKEYTREVPMLMYHHFDADASAKTVVTPETFRAQMEALQASGYTTITMDDLVDYVYHGKDLPDKPVCVTFDDGYLSNYDYAWPVLQELGMTGTIFVIGATVGDGEFYKDTTWPITPHFDYAQGAEMLASGVMDLQSHTYDMHQWPEYESGPVIRSNALKLPGESEADYIAALTGDLSTIRTEFQAELGREIVALAYPGGYHDALSERVLHENGVPVTVTTLTDSRNVLVKGLPQSLHALCRWNVTDDMSGADLVALLEGAETP